MFVPGSEVHQLPHLTEDETAYGAGVEALLQCLEDRLLAKLVVDGQLPSCLRCGGEDLVCLVDGLDKRLLADDMSAQGESLEAELSVRVWRRGHDHDVGLGPFDQQLEALVGCDSGIPLP